MTKKITTENELNRLVTVGRELWNNLTDDERETWACDTGTLGFVEHVFEILHLDTESVDDFEQIHNLIIYPPTVVDDLQTSIRKQIDLCRKNDIEPIQLTEVIHVLTCHLTDDVDDYYQDGNLIYHVIHGRIDILDMTNPRPKFLGSLTISD